MPDRTRYAEARAAGRCPTCARAVSGYVYCDACRARMGRLAVERRYSQRRVARLAIAGICVRCSAQTPDVRGRSPRCDACREALATYRKQLRDARRRAGQCTECGAEPANGHYRGLGPHCSERHARSLAKRKVG